MRSSVDLNEKLGLSRPFYGFCALIQDGLIELVRTIIIKISIKRMYASWDMIGPLLITVEWLL